VYVSGENNWTNWRRISPGSPQAYLFATSCVAIASLLRWGLRLVSEAVLTFPTFYPAVLFSALIGGAGAGVFAAVLGGLIGWWAFMPPHYTFFPMTFGQQIGLLMFFFASLLIVWGADHISGPGFRDRMAAWLRWILVSITPPIPPALGR
jgi:K+-sensing histidine kinase KdpD